MDRPTWDVWFLNIADVIATCGSCSRLQVGAVAVRNRRIIASGYNGAPSGQRECDHSKVCHCTQLFCHHKEEYGDMKDGHCSRAVHGELNLIIQCANEGISLRGSELYLTHNPCAVCARHLAQTGIKRIVYRREYRPDEEAREYLNGAGVKTEWIS